LIDRAAIAILPCGSQTWAVMVPAPHGDAALTAAMAKANAAPMQYMPTPTVKETD
jgi:hypothetical protein